MRNNIWTLCLLVTAMCGQAMGQSAPDVIRRAAEALGGEDRILSLRTLKIEGYGQAAAQNGGANASASVDSPQVWTNIQGYEKTIDLANNRVRVRQRSQAFTSAATLSRGLGNIVTTQVLDGDIAYTVNEDGEARRGGNAPNLRIEMLTHPVALVRRALDATTVVNNLRNRGNQQLVDITTEEGDHFTLGIDRETQLPTSVRWMVSDGMLADLAFQTAFTGYMPIDGVQMPFGFNTVIDFRNIVQSKLYVNRNTVDASIDDLAAPQSVRSAAPPSAFVPMVEAEVVADGIWLLHGNRGHNGIVFEFEDHLTLFEVPVNEAWTLALIETARSLVPDKPLTEAIVSHHHFDHSGGLRTAVAEGLTIIAHRGTEDMFAEIVARPSTIDPDHLGRNPAPFKFVGIDDNLKLEDDTMEIDLYHIIGDDHMAEALMAYVPRDRILVQGDLFDLSWQGYWWRDVYADNVELRNLTVETDVPVHGPVVPYSQVLSSLEEKIERTQQLCMEPAGQFLPTCPFQ